MVSPYGAQIQDDTKWLEIVFDSNLNPIITLHGPDCCDPFPLVLPLLLINDHSSSCLLSCRLLSSQLLQSTCKDPCNEGEIIWFAQEIVSCVPFCSPILNHYPWTQTCISMPVSEANIVAQFINISIPTVLHRQPEIIFIKAQTFLVRVCLFVQYHISL